MNKEMIIEAFVIFIICFVIDYLFFIYLFDFTIQESIIIAFARGMFLALKPFDKINYKKINFTIRNVLYSVTWFLFFYIIFGYMEAFTKLTNIICSTLLTMAFLFFRIYIKFFTKDF